MTPRSLERALRFREIYQDRKVSQAREGSRSRRQAVLLDFAGFLVGLMLDSSRTRGSLLTTRRYSQEDSKECWSSNPESRVWRNGVDIERDGALNGTNGSKNRVKNIWPQNPTDSFVVTRPSHYLFMYPAFSSASLLLRFLSVLLLISLNRSLILDFLFSHSLSPWKYLLNDYHFLTVSPTLSTSCRATHPQFLLTTLPLSSKFFQG